jgi:hypothetical protein
MNCEVGCAWDNVLISQQTLARQTEASGLLAASVVSTAAAALSVRAPVGARPRRMLRRPGKSTAPDPLSFAPALAVHHIGGEGGAGAACGLVVWLVVGGFLVFGVWRLAPVMAMHSHSQ